MQQAQVLGAAQVQSGATPAAPSTAGGEAAPVPEACPHHTQPPSCAGAQETAALKWSASGLECDMQESGAALARSEARVCQLAARLQAAAAALDRLVAARPTAVQQPGRAAAVLADLEAGGLQAALDDGEAAAPQTPRAHDRCCSGPSRGGGGGGGRERLAALEAEGRAAAARAVGYAAAEASLAAAVRCLRLAAEELRPAGLRDLESVPSSSTAPRFAPYAARSRQQTRHAGAGQRADAVRRAARHAQAAGQQLEMAQAALPSLASAAAAPAAAEALSRRLSLDALACGAAEPSWQHVAAALLRVCKAAAGLNAARAWCFKQHHAAAQLAVAAAAALYAQQDEAAALGARRQRQR